jgi:hypothetical protein
MRAMPNEPASNRPYARPDEGRLPLQPGIRVGIFVAVLVATVLGYTISASIGSIACDSCGGLEPVLWGVGGAVVAAAGTSVVAVLLGRSFGEWRMLRSTESTAEEVAGESGNDADSPA